MFWFRMLPPSIGFFLHQGSWFLAASSLTSLVQRATRLEPLPIQRAACGHASSAAQVRTNPIYDAGPLPGSADEDGLVALTGNAGLWTFRSMFASVAEVRLARAKIPWSIPELSV